MELKDLLPVDSQITANFFITNLRDVATGEKVEDLEILYVASVLATYAQVSRFSANGIPPLCNLSDVFDLFICRQDLIDDPEILEIAGHRAFFWPVSSVTRWPIDTTSNGTTASVAASTRELAYIRLIPGRADFSKECPTTSESGLRSRGTCTEHCRRIGICYVYPSSVQTGIPLRDSGFPYYSKTDFDFWRCILELARTEFAPRRASRATSLSLLSCKIPTSFLQNSNCRWRCPEVRTN